MACLEFHVKVVGAPQTLMEFPSKLWVRLKPSWSVESPPLSPAGTYFRETAVSLCLVKLVVEFPSKLWVRLKPSWLVTSPPRSSWVLLE